MYGLGNVIRVKSRFSEIFEQWINNSVLKKNCLCIFCRQVLLISWSFQVFTTQFTRFTVILYNVSHNISRPKICQISRQITDHENNQLEHGNRLPITTCAPCILVSNLPSTENRIKNHIWWTEIFVCNPTHYYPITPNPGTWWRGKRNSPTTCPDKSNKTVKHIVKQQSDSSR